jgi:eukaryotic-like serine/threonine-protein kinase
VTQEAGTSRWLKPGTVLAERYEIVRSIGEGGFGVVYEAHQLGQRARVAVKVLGAAAGKKANLLERFRRETSALARLTSPNVVRIIDSDLLPDGAPFLVMEHLVGHDLETELAVRGQLPPAEAVGYVVQAAAGLAEAHACGVIHRDLKPSNLFLVDEPGGRRVKVLDFGLSKVSAELSLTATHSTLGTPLYVSPEQIRSAKHVDARADVWSLGVILYRLIAGTPPFQADNPTDLLVAIMEREPRSLAELLPGLAPELERVVQRALRKRAEERFASMEEFAAELAPFAPPRAALGSADGPSSRRLSSPPSSVRGGDAFGKRATLLGSSKDTPPPSRKSRALSVGLVVMGVALLATLALGLGSRFMAPGLGHAEAPGVSEGASRVGPPVSKPSVGPQGEARELAGSARKEEATDRPSPGGVAELAGAAASVPNVSEAPVPSGSAPVKPPRKRSRRADLGF